MRVRKRGVLPSLPLHATFEAAARMVSVTGAAVAHRDVSISILSRLVPFDFRQDLADAALFSGQPDRGGAGILYPMRPRVHAPRQIPGYHLEKAGDTYMRRFRTWPSLLTPGRMGCAQGVDHRGSQGMLFRPARDPGRGGGGRLRRGARPYDQERRGLAPRLAGGPARLSAADAVSGLADRRNHGGGHRSLTSLSAS